MKAVEKTGLVDHIFFHIQTQNDLKHYTFITETIFAVFKIAIIGPFWYFKQLVLQI